MKKFQEKVRRRIIFVSILFCLFATYIIILLFFKDNLPGLSDNNRMFQLGFFSSIELLMIIGLIKHIRALKNKEKLKKLYIEENDERTILIMQKSGDWGIAISIIGLALGGIIASFFDQTIFLTLIGATLFLSFVKFFLKKLFSYKY